MKLKDLKIGGQLQLGFATVLLFVIILGVVAYLQTNQLQKQTETIYSHPLAVRNAIGKLNVDVVSIRSGTKDLILAGNDQEKQDAIRLMEGFAADALLQFQVLNEQYLGPKSDIEEAFNAFTIWKTSLEEISRLALSGEIERMKKILLSSGKAGSTREQMVDKIRKIDEYAKDKGKSLYVSSVELNNSLNNQLIVLVLMIVALSLLIYYFLLRSIRRPIKELTSAANRFQQGDLSARSSYSLKNEFGILSASFNSMVETIQQNTELNQKINNLASLMMSEDQAKRFFRTTLRSLSSHTNSQMAAVYLLSEDSQHFECLESIGMGYTARQSFEASILEGEFGAVLLEKRIIHLNLIPEDTAFTFQTASGEFRPREIITIPVLRLNEVVAVISLASLHGFSEMSLKFLNEAWVMLMARINGVLSFKKITDFLEKLDMQNKELEQQSGKLMLQAEELKEFNVELEQQKKQLNEANQLKSAFLSNMSHELRTPLNSVIALSGVLIRRLKNQISEDEYNYLGIIEKNGKQLLSLINDILDLSRIEAGKEEVDYSRFQVQTLVNNILESLEPIANEKDITIINRIQSDLSPIISDSVKCHHILQNIITNALKFTEKGSVEITAELKGGKLYIGIKDTGIGISQEHLSFIFDEFRQADGKSSRKFGGTGLGLAIAKKYTQLLHGSIEVNSQEGAGSIFVVILPEKPDGYELIDSETDMTGFNRSLSFSASTQSGKGKTLLLVEDSEPQIIQLTDMLKDEGYVIHVARNGVEALEAIKISLPDAMILDLMMPELDGFEVLKVIRRQKEASRIPVLILSAKHITSQELSFLNENHIYQLIQKGDVNRNELLIHVSNMVQPQGKAISADQAGKSSERQIQGQATILLIEDNPDNTTTVKALLGEKYKLIYAADGLTGLEKARAHRPNLILLDLSLSEMDSYTVLNEIKKDEHLRHIPTVALTSRAMKGDREDMLRHGFDDYITKPIDSAVLETTILGWLNGSK